MPRTKKDLSEQISEDFRDTVERSDRDTIKQIICQVTLDQLELMEAQAQDEDYQNLKEQAREAGAIYREGTKANNLKIKYAKQILESKGG